MGQVWLSFAGNRAEVFFILCKACTTTTANSAMLVEMTKLSAHRFLTGETQGCFVVRKPHFDQDLIMHSSVFEQTDCHETLNPCSRGGHRSHEHRFVTDGKVRHRADC